MGKAVVVEADTAFCLTSCNDPSLTVRTGYRLATSKVVPGYPLLQIPMAHFRGLVVGRLVTSQI